MRSTIGVALLVAAVGVVPGGASAASGGQPLTGTLELAPGHCDGAGPTGSWFRMILPSGDSSGPFLENGDSTCDDATYTLLSPGTDGGLVIGAYQPEPSPAFDESHNSLATRIVDPVPFFGVQFSASTNAVDPQTGTSVPAPSLRVEGGSVVGDLRSFAASWNDQQFNQGSPKPDGSTPGNTAGPSGSYDPATGAVTVGWVSHISGGPFDGFAGLWHLEGKVGSEADGATAPAPGPAAAPVDSGGGPAVAGAPVAPAGPRSDGDTASAPVGQPDDVGAGAGGVAAGTPTEEVTISTTTVSTGWEPASWLVALITVVGLVAVVAFALADRALRREGWS